MPDMRGCGTRPIDDDIERKEKTTECVEPPDLQVVAKNGENYTESIEDNVCHGVLRQCLHGGILDETAPEPAAELDKHGAGHDNDGGDAELDKGVVSRGETVETFERDLEKGNNHDDREDEDTDWFKPTAADWVCILVLS